MAEWLNAPVLKTGVPQGTASSNLAPSAQNEKYLTPERWVFFVLLVVEKRNEKFMPTSIKIKSVATIFLREG